MRCDRLRVLLAIQAAAFWPVLGWYARRLADRCDEPWGLLPLVTAMVYVRRNVAAPSHARLTDLTWSALATAVYAAAYAFVPPLVSAILAFTALSASVSVLTLNRRFDVGLWALCMLALPVIVTLEFYGGYPLRVLVTRLAAPMLRFAGLHVTAAGACLRWGDMLVAVDAPCSGIKMLWTGGYAAACLVCWRGLGLRQALPFGVAAVGAVVFGNVLRAAALFYMEAGLLSAPAMAHTGVGLAVFAMTVGGILLAAGRKEVLQCV